MKKKQLFNRIREKKILGFTLIELLVVIAIIGLLSSIVLGSLQKARARARDSRRSADIKQIINALALYYSDNGHYPCHELMSDTTSDNNGVDNFLRPLIQKKYYSAVPHDPAGGSVPTIGYYEYATYSNVARDPNNPADPNHAHCGDIVFLGIYTEFGTSPCPSFGKTGYDSGAPGHCHIWYPDVPPAPCGQYAFVNFIYQSDGITPRPECEPFRDTHILNDPIYNDQ